MLLYMREYRDDLAVIRDMGLRYFISVLGEFILPSESFSSYSIFYTYDMDYMLNLFLKHNYVMNGVWDERVVVEL